MPATVFERVIRQMIALVPTSVRNRARNGFIVVAVLWSLTALATLASIYASYVATTVIASRVHDERIQAHALISAAVELAAYQLTAPSQDMRPTRGAFDFRAGNANVVVEFRSEAARIDLNAASKELLAGLFAALGARPASAEDYADRIIGWRTNSREEGQVSGKEASAYRTAGLAYAPREAPFAHVGEMWLVLGIPPQLIERAMPYVTVFSGRPKINVLDRRRWSLPPQRGSRPACGHPPECGLRARNARSRAKWRHNRREQGNAGQGRGQFGPGPQDHGSSGHLA
jgi:general secretion pathway protein K